MRIVELSDFYPYDKDKGGIQELHHKIKSEILSYWGGGTWYLYWYDHDDNPAMIKIERREILLLN